MGAESYGIIVGVIVGLIFSVLIFKICNRNGKIKTQYDERQELIRGRGYKYAMVTAWVMIGIWIVADVSGIAIPVDNGALLFLVMSVSVLVLACYFIWNDSYFGSNNDIKKYIVTFFILTIINGVCAAIFAAEGILVEDGILTFRAINAECALIFIIIGIVCIAKLLAKKNDEDAIEEE